MLPLEGITILDLTRLAPGPHCTMILATWGQTS
jgi:crotonobetainyl-CoA:carnitine CoA-transferase CaiB-like acyl-CoA transferase